MLIDTHCHLFESDYENVDSIVKNMPGIMIASGVDLKSNKEMLMLSDKYSNVFVTLGIHPEYATNNVDLTFIEENIKNAKVVGIGEIGLDYHYDTNHKHEQKNLFIKQIELANKYQLPIVIHSRDACQDTLDILKSYLHTKAIMHCYSYSLEMAKEFLKLGIYFGIGGVLTFKNGQKLKKVVEEIPLDRLVLETDSPYLTPEPFRGKQNVPNNVELVAKKIAEIKNISYEEVVKVTEENAKYIFNI